MVGPQHPCAHRSDTRVDAICEPNNIFPLVCMLILLIADMVPMQACSLLLDHPWKYDNNALHHGRKNKYTLIRGE